MSKQTLGSIVSSFAGKTPDSLDPIEIQRVREQDYLNELIWCVRHAQKKVSCDPDKKCTKECADRAGMDGDFFIESLLKKEKILANTLRNFLTARKSCPTPHFDQTVYRYNSKNDDIEFLWVVPDQETCEIFRENVHQIVKEEQDLLRNVLAYYDGTLFQLSKKMNGENHKPGVALKEK